jgi:hypothetical protein
MRLSLSIDSLLVQVQDQLHAKLLCHSLYYVIYVELYSKALYYK